MHTNPRPAQFIAYLLIAVSVIGAGIPLARLTFFAFSPYKSSSPDSVLLDVYKGQNPNELTKILVGRGLVSNGRLFIWLGRLGRQWKRIKAGEYRISPAMTPIEIFSILTSGISASHPVTIREGENMYEIADDLESKGLVGRTQFLQLCQDPVFMESLGFFKERLPISLEGYLYPDTYFFNKILTDSDMVKQMIRHFFEYWGKAQDDRARELRMTRHDIVTLASIIEKETGAPEERALISSVFHNRLQKRMKLQSDPTTIYGMWKNYSGKIHKSDLSAKNSYNTYHVSALPIGPVSNPGKEALYAALYPASSPYLFFVSHNDGTHEFSRTVEEHNRAVQKFQLNPKAREGKSWRDHYNKNRKPVSLPASNH